MGIIMQRVGQLLSVDVMLHGHVLGQPQQQVIAKSVVDDLIQIFAGNHQTDSVNVDVDQQVVLESCLLQCRQNVILLLKESWSLARLLTKP